LAAVWVGLAFPAVAAGQDCDAVPWGDYSVTEAANLLGRAAAATSTTDKKYFLDKAEEHLEQVINHHALVTSPRPVCWLCNPSRAYDVASRLVVLADDVYVPEGLPHGQHGKLRDVISDYRSAPMCSAIGRAGPPTPGSAQQRQCNIVGVWRHTTPGIGSADWTITSRGDGTYNAQESGLDNASGTATLTGRTLVVTWKSRSGYAGSYQWNLGGNCQSGQGNLTFTQRGQGTHGSTITRSGGGGGANCRVCQNGAMVSGLGGDNATWSGEFPSGNICADQPYQVSGRAFTRFSVNGTVHVPTVARRNGQTVPVGDFGLEIGRVQIACR